MSSPSGPRAFVCERLLAVPQSVTRQNATLVLPAVLVPFTLSYEQELEEAERRMTRAAIPALGKLLSIAMFAAVAIRFQDTRRERCRWTISGWHRNASLFGRRAADTPDEMIR